MRVTRSRELVAEGHKPAVVARVAQTSRQAIYRGEDEYTQNGARCKRLVVLAPTPRSGEPSAKEIITTFWRIHRVHDPVMPDPERPFGFNAAEDPVAYERACVAAVRTAVSGVEDMAVYREVPKHVSPPQLRGEYPDTELVIVVRRGDEQAEFAWRLHGDDFGTPSGPGYQAAPESVADEVLTQVLEFGR